LLRDDMNQIYWAGASIVFTGFLIWEDRQASP
jgi:hypothetical protein